MFVPLGLALEAMHGFKIGLYLDVSNETRRLMWTLAHAHGTLLALVNLAFASTMKLFPTDSVRAGSPWLVGASVAMPVGFLLGGWVTYGGDPGLGIVFVAVGGVMLFVAGALIARGVLSSSPTDTAA